MAFIQQKHSYHRLLDASKRKYLSEKLEEISHDLKGTWQELNKICGRQPARIYPDRSTPELLAAEFNTFFIDRSVVLRSSLTRSAFRQQQVPPITFCAPTVCTPFLNSPRQVKSTKLFVGLPRRVAFCSNPHMAAV